MIEYLSAADEPSQLIRCPVHGFIHYSQNERVIVDHWTFQRLRRIRQLALCHYVYPGATHTRFEHSLGVMEMASRAFDAVVLKNRDLVRRELRQIPELQDDTLARARQVLRTYALLHDVGHPAFSHAAEAFIPKADHEAISAYVLREHLGRTIDGLFFRGTTRLLLRMLTKSADVLFLRQFVAGQIDMDRTDYLLRDSHHCGVEYGRFDFRRLIESLTVYRGEENGQLELAVERGGEHTFEALILARYQMHAQVYFHKIRRIYDHYLLDYMARWAPDHYRTEEDVLKFTDDELMTCIAKDATRRNRRSAVSKRIIERRHHKVIHRTGDYADNIALQTSRRIFLELREQFPNAGLILDNAEGSIHKLVVPGQHDSDNDARFYVVERDGSARLITEDSELLRRIPDRFRTVRIYAEGTPHTLTRIRRKARQVERGN